MPGYCLRLNFQASYRQVATGRRYRCDATEPLRVDTRLGSADLSGMAGLVAAKVSRSSGGGGGGTRRRWGVGSKRTWPGHRDLGSHSPGAGC